MRKSISQITVALLVFGSVAPVVHAAEITDRSLTLSSSIPSDSANYTFNFTVPSTDVIQSFSAEICETAADTCVTPSGFDASGANLINQPSGFGDPNWTVDAADSGALRMTNSGNADTPGGSQSVTFGSVVNPSATNTTFFARITTYENDDYTGAIDDGVVAVSTGEGITVAGFVPPILTFCVGIEISGDCSTATGDNLDMGTFSPNTTTSGTSQFRVATNAGDGYSVTVAGTTLSSGSNTIPALTSQTASQTGAGQFGLNLRNNTNPNVGSNVSGDGSATPSADYGSVDEFKFVDGDIVATAAGPTNPNTFTSSYIVNIEDQQAAGNYTTTLTYIATANF